MLNIKERFSVIKDLIENQDVLDIGCVGLGYQKEEDFWIHGKINKVAKHLLGVDVQKEGIIELNLKGYKVIEADFNKYLDLNHRFDVVNVGQVLTYITNFDMLFDNITRHLSKKGILIISVTNGFSFKNFIKYFFKQLDFVYTNYQSFTSIKYLLEKNNFRIQKLVFLEEPSRKFWGKMYQIILRPLPKHLSSHIIIFAEKIEIS